MSWRPSILTAIAALAATLAVPGTAAADDPPPQVESRAGTEAPAEVAASPSPPGRATPSRPPRRTWKTRATTWTPTTWSPSRRSPTART